MKNHKSQKWENRGQNERRHLPPQRVPEHSEQPQSWELGALCMDVALGALTVLGKDCRGTLCSLDTISGWQGGREEGKQPLLFAQGVCGVPLIKYSLASGLYLLIKLHHQIFPPTPWPLCPRWHNVYCPCQDSLQCISLARGKLWHQGKKTPLTVNGALQVPDPWGYAHSTWQKAHSNVLAKRSE